MLINYSLLRTLLELGSAPTFAQAAARLHLTPSAVSHQVSALEAQVGFKVFERVGRRSRLTAEGTRLFQVVNQHLPPIDDALEALLDDHAAVRGVVRIGGPLPFSRQWLRPRVQYLLRTYPQLTLDVCFGPASVMGRQLLDGQLDLALLAEAVRSPLLESKQLHLEEFVCVGAPSYLRGRTPPSNHKTFSDQVFIVYNQTLPMHTQWWNAWFGQDPPPGLRVACNMANLDEMLFLAEQGLGIAVLPNYLVRTSLAQRRVVRLQPTARGRGAAWRNPLTLAWRKAAVETSRVKAVRSALLALDVKDLVVPAQLPAT